MLDKDRLDKDRLDKDRPNWNNWNVHGLLSNCDRQLHLLRTTIVRSSAFLHIVAVRRKPHNSICVFPLHKLVLLNTLYMFSKILNHRKVVKRGLDKSS